ncbi:MAG TPA: hypothetical protein VFU21_13185, partial [Kofleriaceae bacterium]|nr:hypothetical protein [Kofleriaceae bacterium]
MTWARLAAVLLLPVLPAAAAGGTDPTAPVDRAIARWEATCRAPAADGACVRERRIAVKDRCQATT